MHFQFVLSRPLTVFVINFTSKNCFQEMKVENVLSHFLTYYVLMIVISFCSFFTFFCIKDWLPIIFITCFVSQRWNSLYYVSLIKSLFHFPIIRDIFAGYKICGYPFSFCILKVPFSCFLLLLFAIQSLLFSFYICAQFIFFTLCLFKIPQIILFVIICLW